MPVRRAVDQLPTAVREWLEAELVRRGFSGYQELVEALNAELAKAGVDATVSKSALHRFGQDIEAKLDAIRNATQVARTLVTEIGDDEGAMNEALMRTVQTELFQLVVESSGNLDAAALSKIGTVASNLSRASVQQKRYRTEVKARAEKAAAEVEQTARSAGLSDDAVQTIRSKILGIPA